MIRGSNAKMINCTVRSNFGFNGSHGGGMYCRNSLLEITNCTIHDNSAIGTRCILRTQLQYGAAKLSDISKYGGNRRRSNG